MRKKFSKKDKSKRKHLKMLEKRQQSIQSNLEYKNISGNVSIPKKMRLNKVVKELNMSMSRIILRLAENNFNVDNNPNAVIEEEALKFLFGDKGDDTNNPMSRICNL